MRSDSNLRKVTPAGVESAFVGIRSGDELEKGDSLEVPVVRGLVRW